ncbi:MAG: (d)CMP kinase [Anaerolineaceae bacterium]|nr:(d)CMP kinase [Anaerolineaceae bacterium]
MNHTERPLVIAIDGPAASGKSTLAEKLAMQLGFFYFDTGVMYRVATLAALQELGSVEDEAAVTSLTEKIQIDVQPASVSDGRTMDVLLNGVDVTWEIRNPEVERGVSPVSAYQGVRTNLTARQREIGLRGNIVMVGRDIGTVVFPDARFKFYLDATPEERARRRFLEVQQRGETRTYAEILENVLKRDGIDSTRKHAPLKRADDAIIVDTNNKTVEEEISEVLEIINHALQEEE